MPQFRYVITKRADNKDDYFDITKSVEEFISLLVGRGHEKGEKNGSGIIGAVFKPKGARLEQKNVDVVTAVILDVDGKFKRNGQVVIEPVDPDWFIGKLPYRGIAHTSYTHTPAHPKFRVILPLDRPISIEEHRRLWYWLFNRIEQKCDPSCKNADRMFYLPRTSKEAVEQKWPWIRELHGKVLSVDDVPADFLIPSEQSPHEWQKSQKKQGAHFAAPDTKFAPTDGHKLLEKFMGLPLVAWAKENPELVTREVWRGLATNLGAIALEDESDEALYEECLNAFHEISEQDELRYSHSDTTRCFIDALKSARNYGPMTFSRISENGAPDDVVYADQKTPISAARLKLRKESEAPYRPKADAPTAVTPTPVGAAAPKAEETPAPAAGTPPPPPPGVTYEEPEDFDEGDPNGDIFDHKPEDFLFNAAKPADGGGYIQRSATGEWRISDPISSESFNQMLKTWGLRNQKQIDSFRAQIRFFNTCEKVWDKPTEYYVVKDGIPSFNTYKPSSLVPSPGNWDDIRTLLLNLVGNDVNALEYLLDWIAAPLQSLRNQGKTYKLGTAIVFKGEQGSGKGTLESIMAILYGDDNVSILSQDTLDNRFNDQLVGKLFVSCNEVMSSSNRSQEVANKLKMWITDPRIPVEGKFAQQVVQDNCFNIMFSSNNDRPVLIEKGDRRHSVFFSRKFDRTVSSRIHVDIRSDRKPMIAAFFDFLLSRQVQIQYGDLYDTEARKELTIASLPSDERFAEEIREEGWLSVAEPWRQNGPPNNPRIAVLTEKEAVSKTTVQDVYKDWCQRNGLRARGGSSLQQALKQVMPQLVDDRVRVGGIQHRVWLGLPMRGVADVIEFPKKDAAPAEPAEPATKTDTGDFSA